MAANQYKRLSNTYFCDRCLGWSGVCVEPNSVYWEELREKRSCHVVPHCVSNVTDEITFVGGDSKLGVFGGIDGSKFSNFRRSSRSPTQMRCLTTQAALDRSHVKHVHLMSLDVEGHEASVLAGINFQRTRIDNILCESNCDSLLPSLYVRTTHFVGSEWLWQLRDHHRHL